MEKTQKYQWWNLFLSTLIKVFSDKQLDEATGGKLIWFMFWLYMFCFYNRNIIMIEENKYRMWQELIVIGLWTKLRW